MMTNNAKTQRNRKNKSQLEISGKIKKPSSGLYLYYQIIHIRNILPKTRYFEFFDAKDFVFLFTFSEKKV